MGVDMSNYDDEKYYDESCIFCKIVKGDIPSSKVYEDDYVIAFNDMSPKAKVHLLVVPKPHVKDIMATDEFLMLKVLEAIKFITKQLDIADKGFRVINNCGASAGQTVFHVHFHIMSGGLKDF